MSARITRGGMAVLPTRRWQHITIPQEFLDPFRETPENVFGAWDWSRHDKHFEPSAEEELFFHNTREIVEFFTEHDRRFVFRGRRELGGYDLTALSWQEYFPELPKVCVDPDIRRHPCLRSPIKDRWYIMPTTQNVWAHCYHPKVAHVVTFFMLYRLKTKRNLLDGWHITCREGDDNDSLITVGPCTDEGLQIQPFPKQQMGGF